SRVRPLLDGAIVAGALLLVSWLTVMRAVYTAGGTDPFTFDLGLAYPIGDVVTMVIVLSALSQTRRLDSSLAVVFAGISVITVTDSIYGYLTATNGYEGPNLIDVGWVIGYLLVGLRPLIARRPPSSLRAALPTSA